MISKKANSISKPAARTTVTYGGNKTARKSVMASRDGTVRRC